MSLPIITIDQWPHDLIRERKVLHALEAAQHIERALLITISGDVLEIMELKGNKLQP